MVSAPLLYHDSESIQYSIEILMNIRTATKMVPNLFSPATEEDQFNVAGVQRQQDLFRQSQNNLNSKNSRKKERRQRVPKNFIQADECQDGKGGERENKQNNEFWWCRRQDNCQQAGGVRQKLQIRHKPQLLLDLQLDQQQQQQKEKSNSSENFTQALPNNDINISCANLKRLHLLDWVSDTEGQQSKTADAVVPFQPDQPEPAKEAEPFGGYEKITSQVIFQQIPHNKTINCFVRRDKKSVEGVTQYNVYFEHNLQHVLTIRKQGIWKYCLLIRQSLPGPRFLYTKVASLQSTFFGNHYSLIKQDEKYSSLTVSYETNILGLNGPRKMKVYTPNKVVPFEYLNQCLNSKQWKTEVNTFVNKDAVWDQNLKSYTLNFKGRALKSSIKNFVIIDEKRGDNCIIFAKAGFEVYNLDISYPFSLIQGIAVAISSFQRKLTCD